MLAAAAWLIACLAAYAPAAADQQVALETDGALTASLGGGAGRTARVVDLPVVLSASDAARYRRIFDVQESGRWALADREMARLSDPLLKGHVLAQRYLHRAYRTPYRELKDWLDAYGDHPEADRLYRLARQRMPRGGPAPKVPVRGQLRGVGIDTGDDEAHWERAVWEGDSGSPAERRRVRSLKLQFRGLLRRNLVKAALRMLDSAEVKRWFGPTDMAELKYRLAAHLFARGEDKAALRWAGEAAEGAGGRFPQAHWIAGLARWRTGEIAAAGRDFERVATADGGSGWMIAAGAFWAARANLVARRPEAVNRWLEIAAGHPRTFYGLLARRALGQPLDFAWEPAPFTRSDADLLLRLPGGRRVLALLQLEERQRAEAELRRLSPSASPVVGRTMLALANAANMPEVALRLGGVIAQRDGRFHDNADYPLPNWQPQGGWVIDRALVYAFARQESSFNPRARSRAGAAGLMQLMPATARHLAGRRVSREQLFDPAFNLALGQRYMKELLEHEKIAGNLFLLLAAYNSGPSNLFRWRKAMKDKEDPLLFIESLPSRETRVFVERVLTNFWIYRDRLGQPTPSLDAVVAGDWPTYAGFDGGDGLIARK